MEVLGAPDRPRPWALVRLVCFADPDIDGNYFGERDYSMLFSLAPNIQYAFERLDEAVAEARAGSSRNVLIRRRFCPHRRAAL